MMVISVLFIANFVVAQICKKTGSLITSFVTVDFLMLIMSNIIPEIGMLFLLAIIPSIIMQALFFGLTHVQSKTIINFFVLLSVVCLVLGLLVFLQNRGDTLIGYEIQGYRHFAWSDYQYSKSLDEIKDEIQNPKLDMSICSKYSSPNKTRQCESLMPEFFVERFTQLTNFYVNRGGQRRDVSDICREYSMIPICQ
jgi:hypothetical protein